MELERFPHNNFSERELLEMSRCIIETEPLKRKILKKVNCKKCGWCCKNQGAMLTVEDVKRLMVHFKCSYEELSERYFDKKMNIPYLKSPCPFLGSDNRCGIYYLRPKVCKIYPFTDFFMVVKPCLLGEEILDMMIKSGRFVQNNGQYDDSYLQRLYDSRVSVLNNITGMETSSKDQEHHSVFMNKEILKRVMKMLKDNN